MSDILIAAVTAFVMAFLLTLMGSAACAGEYRYPYNESPQVPTPAPVIKPVMPVLVPQVRQEIRNFESTVKPVEMPTFPVAIGNAEAPVCR